MTRFTETTPLLAVSAEAKADAAAEPTRFWELAGPHERKLYNYIKKTLAFSTDADDVYQETLLRALKYFRSYRDSRSFATWFFAIAHNEIRRHFKHPHEPDAAGAAERLTTKDENVDRVLVREVYRFAEGLRPRHREVFFLFYDGGFSVAEIARVTGLRQGNIKFILNRARASLRKTLGGSHE
jgi:RNA polymerase sigma-70 factor (ECF subfamily)